MSGVDITKIRALLPEPWDLPWSLFDPEPDGSCWVLDAHNDLVCIVEDLEEPTTLIVNAPSYLVALCDRVERLEAALRDACETVGRSHRGWIGDHGIHEPQINDAQLNRWRAALDGEGTKP